MAELDLLKTPSGDKWDRIDAKKRAGVLVPLFSVYSKKTIGIADFSDLKLLIDWAKKCGNSIIQLLPMNEMGGLNCPYDAISSFALEPLYISLEEIASSKNKSIKAEIDKLRKDFPPGQKYIDYSFKNEKLKLLRRIYALENGLEPDELNSFKHENHYWLKDFTLYKALKERFKNSAWYEWEDKLKARLPEALESFEHASREEIDFQTWLQWLCSKQFENIRDYARSRGVLLKGDLPMLVSRDSADVWSHPEFFKLDFAAGAPPDMYCAKGQRWGMPTYNWEHIAYEGFRYLKEKLKYADNFYDILRIDHVVGMFRIWSIPYNEPLENKGLNGLFDPADESKWGEQGKAILKIMLENVKMLLCAEDLGVIPKVCIDTLKELGIPGNDVERWVKDWNVKHDFLKPEEYRATTVAMLSTHDTTNWPAWWENEAGTVDEDLFIRKCNERGIDFLKVKEQLFDPAFSCHGRLRWRISVDSVSFLLSVLGRRKEEVMDFVDLYENSFREKEKLWRQLGLRGQMREKSSPEIVRSALNLNLASNAIFCINSIFDYLFLTDSLKANPYEYRINTPGTISAKNWSLTIPIALEELQNNKVNKEIKKMVADSSRV